MSFPALAVMDLVAGVGHGSLGLRSGLRPYDEFLEETGAKKDVCVELRPGVTTKDWVLDQGSTYQARIDYSYDRKRLDVVAVRSLLDTGLSRAESLVDCRGTAGTFFYDPDQEFGTAFQWDSSTWDDGVSKWDQFPLLYVHLADNSDPALTTVTAYLAIYFGSAPMVHPALSADKFTDGGFENWTSPTQPTNWTVALGVGVTVNQETADVKQGSNACRFDVSASSLVAFSSVTSTPAVTNGKRYRISGYYKTDSAWSPNIDAQIRVLVAAGTVINSQGREITAVTTEFPKLSPTNGDWRRFAFDVLVSVDALVAFRVGTSVTVAGATGKLWLDGLKFQRIWRYNYYEPRVGERSIPSVETGSNDVFFGGKRIGIGSITLINADGKLEQLLGSLEWLNKDIIIDSVGQFADNQEILLDDAQRHFTGQIQAYRVDDDKITVEMQDSRVFFHVILPPRVYSDVDNPKLNLAFLGRPRPLFFGQKDNINPVRIDKEATFAKYGVYELADTKLAPNGIVSVDAVYSYLNEQAAGLKDTTKRITLTNVTHYTVDLSAGKVTIVTDVKVYEVTVNNNKLNFDTGGAELTATLATGLYAAAALASQVTTQLVAAGGAGLSCSYSDTTNKFTVTKTTGTLNLLCKTGGDKDIQGWPLIGFRKSANRTGALTYDGDDATFSDAEKSHFIRCNAKGFRDTAAGKYTGTANALIGTGADICQVLIEKYLKKPYSLIDQVSFVFARSRAPESIAIYLKDPTSTKDIFTRLEYSNVANIVVDGSGTISYNVYVGTIPASAPTLYDRDYMAFSIERAVADVYQSIVVRYNQDAASGDWQARQALDDSVALRYGRVDQRIFETYVRSGDNAALLANRLLTLAQRPARKVLLSVKGKLLRAEVGSKVKLVRKRALDPAGSLAGQAFRIISIKKSPEEGTIEADLVDDVVTVAGVACQTQCQALCEGAQQGCGFSTCQDTCQTTGCQVGCQATTQGCGFTTCQATCEATCQGCGQTSCQVGCQIGCEASCQATCQGCGQTTCQTACETACQGCGQTTCQTGCQTSCQACGQAGFCQSSCQTTCQICGQSGFCQEACQASCQTGCQVQCQSSCQTTCQTTSEILP